MWLSVPPHLLYFHPNKKPMALKFTPQLSSPSQLPPISKNILSISLKVSTYPVLFCSSMATSISATGFKGGLCSSFHGSWGTSMAAEDYALLAKAAPARTRVRVRKPIRMQPMMKNVNEGKGLFAPIVVLARNIIGKKRFNQFRGKAIALHSQVITEFCKSIGADAKQRQGLIRLAKKNGERLGFLA